MHDTLFKIGNLTVYSYGFMIAVGIIAAVVLFRVLCDRRKIDDKTYNFYLMNTMVAIAVGFGFAALYQMIYHAIETGRWEFNGITFMGGLIGAVLSFAVGTVFVAKVPVQRDFWRIANIITPCILIAHGFGRIGCFLAGCCYGVRTDSWIGVKFPFLSYKVVPTQLIEAIFLFILCGVTVLLLLKWKKEDWLMLIYLYSYAVFRFIIEFWRGDDRGGAGFLSPSQWQSFFMLAVAIALTVYIYVFKRRPFQKGFQWKWNREKPLPATEPPVLTDETAEPIDLFADEGTTVAQDNSGQANITETADTTAPPDTGTAAPQKDKPE